MENSPTRDPGSDHADVVILPPILYVGSIVLAILAKRFVGGSLLAQSPARWVAGALLVLVGLGAGFLFRRSFRRTGQSPNPLTPTPQLIFDGPYRFSRNPAYVGLTVMQAGLAVLLNNPWMAAVLVPIVVIIHYGVILREEAYLERKFGDEYRAYQARVRRWL